VTGPITEKDVYTYYPGLAQPSARNTSYNVYGLVTSDVTYDFGGSGTNFVRSTTTEYGTYSGPIDSTDGGSCSTISTYIQNRPCRVKMVDSTGHILSEMVYQYDVYGNVTTMNRPSPADGKNLATSFTYDNRYGDTLNTLATSTDQSGTLTTYANTSCNNFLPTSVTTGGLTKSFTWDCYGGVVTSVSDEHGNSWQYGFSDPMGRLTSMTDPTNSTGYPTAVNIAYTPTTMDTKMTPNGGAALNEMLRTSDSSGRPHVVQTAHSTTNYSSSETDYDADGRPNRITVT
jgi:YD repeat-containing protein